MFNVMEKLIRETEKKIGRECMRLERSLRV